MIALFFSIFFLSLFSVTTELSHDSEQETLVSGYDPALSYSRDIRYSEPWMQIDAVIAASQTCKQYIKVTITFLYRDVITMYIIMYWYTLIVKRVARG